MIQKALQDQLAELILSRAVADGETILVDAGPEGRIVGDRPASPPRPGKDERPAVHGDRYRATA